MTTEMKSAAGEVRIGLDGGDRVGIRTFNIGGDQVDVRSVDRADFLAAVAAECDAIVIPREALPEVSCDVCEAQAGETVVNLRAINDESAAERSRRRSLEDLALAEYLDAHPPVDEAQVEALAGVVRDVAPLAGLRYEETARRLYAAGVRIEVKP